MKPDSATPQCVRFGPKDALSGAEGAARGAAAFEVLRPKAAAPLRLGDLEQTCVM
jgi:hypothetical protein